MIIGISGLIGSGKDTVADYLVKQHGFVRDSWAASLKDAVAKVFDWDRNLLEGLTDEARLWRERIDPWWSKRLDMPHLTPRWILQYWGTDVCRVGFHDDIWVASVESRISKTNKNVVLSDCRFINELQSIKRMGGITLRMKRGPDPEWITERITDFDSFKLKYPHVHASEYSIVAERHDVVIYNNGTIHQLHGKINDLLQDHQFSK